MFKPIKHVFATFLRKLCKTDGCSQKEYGWKSEETHEPVMASFVLIAPSAVHMLRQRSERRILPWMEIPALQLWLQRRSARHFRWPSSPLCTVPGISPNHNGITSKRRLGESDFIIWGCGDVCADRKKGARGPLAPLPCQPAFFFLLNTHTHISTLMHTYTCLKISAQGSAHQSKINLNTPQIFCHFKKIV